jgi:hypothetical protein
MLGRTSIIAPIAILSAIMLIAPLQAKAEWAIDAYSGMGFTRNHNASVNLPDAGISGAHENLKFDSSLNYGSSRRILA